MKSLDEIERVEQIAACLLKNELYALLEVLELNEHLPFHKRLSAKRGVHHDLQARALRNVFEELGGAFLKLGQMISMRPDLVGAKFSKEFDSLLDNVPPEPFETIKKVIDAHVPGGMHAFEQFDHTPIAAGSVAQVHRAVLRPGVGSKSGVEVAVKVQRPDARRAFEVDIALMMLFARKIEEHYHPEFIDPVDVVEEFKKYTRKELDFNHEASNMTRFAENFRESKSIVIPKAYRQLSTSDVLVMELLSGHKITSAIHFDARERHRIIQEVFSMCFKQLFEDGFFHADLHAGNILILRDHRIGLLDYGIVGYIDRELKEKLISLFVALVNGDLDQTADALMDLNIGTRVPDKNMLKEGIYYALADYYGSSLEHMEFSKIIYDAIDTATRSRIRMPAQLVLFSKSLATMEGFCKELDPTFNLVAEAKPYVKRLVVKQMNPVTIAKDGMSSLMLLKRMIVNTPQSIKEFTGQMKLIESSIVDLDSKFSSMQHLMIKITKSIVYGMIIAALIVSSALLVNIGPKYYDLSLYSIVLFGAAIVVGILIVMALHDRSY